MAKADLKKVEDDWKPTVGKAVARCFALAGVSAKEAAALMGDRDPAQVSRWMAGTERPQFDAILAAEPLRQPLVVALAEVAGAQVETTVTIRRSA